MNNNIENNDILENAFDELFEVDPPVIDETSFSLFDPPVYNTKPKESVTLFQISEMIKSSLFAQLTNEVLKNLDLKTKILLFATFAGTFLSRSFKGMISYAQQIVIDIDHLIDARGTKELLIKDAFLNVALAFISPSQKGLKLVIKIEEGMPEEHELYFNAISSWLLQKYNLEVDKSGKDLARICFLCADPECFYSPSGSVNRADLLKLLPPLAPPPSSKVNDSSLTLPPAPRRFSDILNKMPEVYERAVSALLNSGWQQKGEYFYRPGRQLNEHHAAILNIDPADGLWKFTNFSTQAFPFLVKGYSLTQIICELCFGGDFSACITELSQQYLPPKPNLKFSSAMKQESNLSNVPDPYFHIRNFSEVITDGSKAKPILKIAGAFLRQNTNTYFFSRTNLGKSIFGFQIAYAIATGTSIDPHPALCNECPPMRVLYADLEMDEKTIFDRHKLALSMTSPVLMQNLIFIHEFPQVKPLFNLDLLAKIEKTAVDNYAQLIIIDNISKLIPDLVDAVNVSCVIETLKRVRQKIGASFLVIGHTTKSDSRTAITPQSYYGSAHLQNFFTEIFFLDSTRDSNFFLCHAKTKHAENYTENVPVLSRGVHPVVGVGFSFKNIQPISEVQLPLTISGANTRGNLADFRNEIITMQQAGIKPKRIADIFGVNRSSISRFLKSAP